MQSETGKSSPLVDPRYLIGVIESGMKLLVSQALVSQYDPEVASRDKAMIFRELQSEVTSVMNTMSRRKSSAGKSPVSPFGPTPIMQHLMAEIIDKMVVNI